ncbi:hypothetical protein L208DRAFT_1561233 [Tricholoma matsutake]|nr:hypothetical protein L208DRAFT_1561233 [Tricholoma matsutake 945]
MNSLYTSAQTWKVFIMQFNGSIKNERLIHDFIAWPSTTSVFLRVLLMLSGFSVEDGLYFLIHIASYQLLQLVLSYVWALGVCLDWSGMRMLRVL